MKAMAFRNENHTICCGLSGILFSLELVEANDAQHQAPPNVYDGFSKTIGLLMQQTHSMGHTGHVVVLDSGFCVLQGIVELCKKGVFAAAQIKKCAIGQSISQVRPWFCILLPRMLDILMLYKDSLMVYLFMCSV